MMRVELLHPMSVHFPIALLIVGTFFRLIAVSFPKRWGGPSDFLAKSSYLLTFVGVISAWIAWYLGTLAEEEVNSNLCDPTITHLHGDYALYVTLIFTGISIIDCAGFIFPETSVVLVRLRCFLDSRAVRFSNALLSVAASALLAYVGHLGASLTYNQAAGVYVPSPQCTEFSDERP